MPSLDNHVESARHWRSLDELADTPEFRSLIGTEFPNLANMLQTAPTRRQFLKVMGASLALGGLTGCRWPKEEIVPFANQPPGRIPGEPVRYATTMELSGVGTGLLVTSYDGRPIKIEGNDLHSGSLGRSSAQMQAAILEMYDPDRSTTALERVGTEWQHRTNAQFDAALKARLTAPGAGCYVLSESSSSPTLAAARERLRQALPAAQWLEYEPLSCDNEREGTRLAYGTPLRAHVQFDQADVLFSLDCDFLQNAPNAVRATRDFAARRSASDGAMNRLYCAESVLSLTGSNADHRYAVRASELPAVLVALANELLAHGLRLPESAAALGAGLRDVPAGAFPFVAALSAELLASGGRCAIVVGPRQSAEAHALGAALNAALGAVGKGVQYTAAPDAQRPTHLKAIAALANDLEAGKVKTLLILGGNPAYNAPAELKLGEKLAKAEFVAHLALYHDETGRLAHWHVPAAHFLEAWSDSLAWDGTLSITQPLIEPLFGGRTAAELISAAVDAKPASGYEQVRATLRAKWSDPADFEARWRGVLHDGLAKDTALAPFSPTLATAGWAAVVDGLKNRPQSSAGSFDVVFAQDNKIYDGRFANNAWLHEFPDPLTKMTWDNAALISTVDAAKFGIRRDDRIEITVAGRTMKIPVCVLPGHAPGAITLPLGYGRQQAGVVAKGAGFDVYPLRTSEGWHLSTGAAVKVVSGRYPLVTTQDHHYMSNPVPDAELQRRVPELVRVGTLETYKKDPKFVQHIGHSLPLVQMFQPAEQGQHRWAMSIDLSKCTGCGACVVACQAENNIPVVGKGEVALGREMHWMRIDRYFQGQPDQPDAIKVVHQPVNCMHCENAPCEQVCPVAATVHDSDGLNVMVYNRCIGTRYCSNNCPYKVRRFNWFNNNHGPQHPRSLAQGTIKPLTWSQPGLLPLKRVTEIEMLGKNPKVSVRSRGVMEKCTYCTQRIADAKIRYRNESVTPKLGNEKAQGAYAIPDGVVTTACAQACPAEAIVFGDLAVSGSKVAAAHAHDRSYAMLEEINVRPRTKYLAKLRNPVAGPAPADAGGHHDAHETKGHG